uniref:Receptor protein-tyrosine kinase n=1 Tax=Amphiprion percula TaxID=161767 RepID=A0A3P8TCB2_AMPPE
MLMCVQSSLKMWMRMRMSGSMRKVQVVLCVLLPCALQLCGAETQEAVVCSGTQNGLSTTANSELQYNQTKERYTGCDIVIGNLEITMMDHTRDFSFLQSIKEVTGYILFALNVFSRLPLDHLRVIRGTTLYEDQYALAVMINYQRDGQHGLQELGLTHLTEILEGGVKIIQNKYLSYAPQVNWRDIVKDEKADIMIEDNGPKMPCDKACGDLPCWGPGNDTCQILTKTVCALQCNGRCFGTKPSDCCHSECAGGCTGPLDTDCFACRNFNNLGSCVPQCPQTLIYNKHTFKMEPNPNAKYQYGSLCVAQCPTNFVVDGSSCVSSCPSDKMEVEKNGVKRCEPCGGLCPKACHGTGSPTSQTVDAHNIDSFINCTRIQGSLQFLVNGIEGDRFMGVPPLDPEKLKIFNTVQEITGYLSIHSWPENMTDLSVFSNLQTIQGRTLFRGYSLLVMGSESLKSLGLRSLRKINDGDINIRGNKKLCYHNTVNWTRILSSSSRPQRRQKHIDVKENRPLNECVNDNHVCDPLCSSDGCWGPGPNQCVSCNKYSRGGTCVPDCMFLSGEKREFATPSGECMPCHPECKVQEGKQTCTGSGADQCVACAGLQDGPHCVSSCPEGVMGGEEVIFKYPNKQGHCEPCHVNCTKGCSGPRLRDCVESSRYISGQETTAIVLGVIALIFLSFSIFVLTVLYRRGLAIRRKRAMRRYMESGGFEPMEEKGSKVHARILKPSELRKVKLLGNGVFGSVYKGYWIPEGDTVKLPVAIKTIHDRSGRQTFCELTDHMLALGSLNHINVVRTQGICTGDSLQLVTQLCSEGTLLEYVRKYKNKLSPQRMLNWCVQIAKGMNYLEENRIIHRNLAARNVFLKNNFTVQISDYGIADLLYPDDKKYFYNEVKTPIKWMALESILFRRYTHQSDVWSYGVTIWEMMSYGAEPYAAMRSQEVPDLLEKGERLSQPQICTIDVYMVMVKCWMIDENVRPTFKELASEFARMARDPPRYLVIKEDCSQQDTSPDELVQRSADLDDLDDLEIELEELGAEAVVDGVTPVPQYLSRSLSRLSRMDTHRVVLNPSTVAGYLPMTPGVDNQGQAMWQSRSRLNSARTVSESSEGCGTAVELEMSEDFSLAGSLKRRRHREDSAYVSQRDSMSGGQSDTPSPEMEEEDQNGYVLPGNSPERDTLLYSSRATSGRMGKSHSSGLLDDPDDEEYEYMNKQTCATPVSPRHSSHWGKQNKKRTSSVSSQATACSCDTMLSMEVRGAHMRTKDNSDSERQGSNEVQYEYMDIRGSEKEESPPAHDPPPPPASVRMRGEEEEEYVEDSNYHYTNRQPKLRQALRDGKELKMQERDEGEGYEYEDMDYFAAPPPADAAVYQNVQRQPEGAAGGNEAYQSGFDPHVKVRAGVGVGEPAAADRSFDNPGYWHSRMFLKPKAVPT